MDEIRELLNEIECLEDALRAVQAATSDKAVLAITDRALCDDLVQTRQVLPAPVEADNFTRDEAKAAIRAAESTQRCEHGHLVGPNHRCTICNPFTDDRGQRSE